MNSYLSVVVHASNRSMHARAEHRDITIKLCELSKQHKVDAIYVEFVVQLNLIIECIIRVFAQPYDFSAAQSP